VSYFKEFAPQHRINQLVQYNPNWRKFIKMKHLTEEALCALVSRKAEELRKIPPEKRTKKVCQTAVERSRVAIQWIPPEIYEDGMVMKQALKNKAALKYIKSVKEKQVKMTED